MTTIILGNTAYSTLEQLQGTLKSSLQLTHLLHKIYYPSSKNLR